MRIPAPKSIPTFESRSFVAEVTGDPGNHSLRILATSYYRTFLNKHLKPGELVTLTLTNSKPKRTEAQNRYYWVYLSEIAAETGNDAEDLQELFKAKFLPRRMVEVLGENDEKRSSTTGLSRLEFGEYIDKIAELTGIVPPPLENVRGT